MGKIPAYSWFPSDFLGSLDCTEMTLEEQGAYRRLLDISWEQEPQQCYLPNDPKRLAKWLRVPPSKFTKIWRKIEGKFVKTSDSKFLYNVRLFKQWEKQEGRRKTNVTNARLGGRPKNRSQSDGKPMANHSVSDRSNLAKLIRPVSVSTTHRGTGSTEETDHDFPPLDLSKLDPDDLRLLVLREVNLVLRPEPEDFNQMTARKWASAILEQYGGDIDAAQKAIHPFLIVCRKAENPIAWAQRIIGASLVAKALAGKIDPLSQAKRKPETSDDLPDWRLVTAEIRGEGPCKN